MDIALLKLVVIPVTAAAFLAAGLANLIGPAAIRRSFFRWGYPPWAHRAVGAAELLAAGLILYQPARASGLALAACVLAGAVATLVRHRDWSHLPGAAAFVAIITAAMLAT